MSLSPPCKAWPWKAALHIYLPFSQIYGESPEKNYKEAIKLYTNHLRDFTFCYLGIKKLSLEIILSGLVTHCKWVNPLQEQVNKGPAAPGWGQIRSYQTAATPSLPEEF